MKDRICEEGTKMKFAKAVVVVLALSVLGAISVTGARADEWNKKTKVTFNQPVEIPGHALPAGTYTFKLLDSAYNRNIVQVFSADETKLIATILAINNYRLESTGETLMMFSERPANVPSALKAWFYPNNRWGHEFVYPKARAVQLAVAEKEPILALPTEPRNIEALKRAPVVAETPEQKEVQVAEVFETTPPAREPVTVAQAQALPKTASPVPLIALLGIGSLGFAFALRRFAKQHS
jgi:hypothetical protein